MTGTTYTHPGLGVVHTSATFTSHILKRSTGRTLCGRTIAPGRAGVELTSRRQVKCLRCYKLAFRGPNACAPGCPDTPHEVSPAPPAMLEREPDEAAAIDGAAPRPLEPSDRHMFAAGDVRDTTGEWMGR